MERLEKLKILAESAKYDVSCSSSGSKRQNKKGGIGDAAACGICHSWSADGRCISLLKILLSNDCIYDCAYCVNRASHDHPRASFSPAEIADITLNFYRRNYIEGLFLSSAVLTSPNRTMELILETVRLLRDVHHFNGYIHAKAVPYADQEILSRLGQYVDRLSVNLEFPSEQALEKLAPNKTMKSIYTPMSQIRDGILINREERTKFRSAPRFVPGGQSTQMIIGASDETDHSILKLTENLYSTYRLKRVYYSAYVPVFQIPGVPALKAPPLLRENRLYQADWLLRFYDFKADELIGEEEPNLDLTIDPKLAWALNHMSLFPVDVNRADLRLLLRVPGIGPRSARKIVAARRYRQLDFHDLRKLGIVMKRAQFFLTCKGKMEGSGQLLYPDKIKEKVLSEERRTSSAQLSIWDLGAV